MAKAIDFKDKFKNLGAKLVQVRSFMFCAFHIRFYVVYCLYQLCDIFLALAVFYIV